MLGKFISLSLGDFPPGLGSREMDLPGRPEVGSPAASAGDTGPVPDPGGCTYTGQLGICRSYWAPHCRAHVPQLLKPMHLELVPEIGEATAVREKKKRISEMFGVWPTCGGTHCKFLARGSRKMSCLEKTFWGWLELCSWVWFVVQQH